MKHDSKTTKQSLLGSARGREKNRSLSSGEVLIHLPELAEDGWAEIDVDFPTGLAGPGTVVRVLVEDDDLPPAQFFLGTTTVLEPGKVRLRICNNGLYRSPARDFPVRLLPLEDKRPSLFPEIKFDLPEIKI